MLLAHQNKRLNHWKRSRQTVPTTEGVTPSRSRSHSFLPSYPSQLSLTLPPWQQNRNKKPFLEIWFSSLVPLLLWWERRKSCERKADVFRYLPDSSKTLLPPTFTSPTEGPHCYIPLLLLYLTSRATASRLVLIHQYRYLGNLYSVGRIGCLRCILH